MSDNMKSIAGKGAPWRRGVAWWVVFVEGLVAVALGLYILIRPQHAGQITLQLMGAYLLFVSLTGGYRAYQESDRLGLIAAGVGILAAAIAMLFPRVSGISPAAAIMILALGLMLAAIAGFVSLIREPSQGTPAQDPRWGPFLASSLQALLAILLFISSIQGGGALILAVIGWIILSGGAALLVFAYTLYRKRSDVGIPPAEPVSQ